MPFLRFSRDKRGYESTYLVHASTRHGKPSRPRVLYWYRTPPGIRVGRPPFDEEVRRRLEQQNPDIVFDWKAIAATPFPPPTENEQWRERRRAERAAKQAAREEELGAGVENRAEEDRGRVAETPAAASEALPSADERAVPTEIPEEPSESVAAAPVEIAPGVPRKRRRRGGRRRRGRATGSPPQQPSASSTTGSHGEIQPSDAAENNTRMQPASEEIPSADEAAESDEADMD